MNIAEQIARIAHRGQVDKAGKPYIEHVARVVSRVAGDEVAEAQLAHPRDELGFRHGRIFCLLSMSFGMLAKMK